MVILFLSTTEGCARLGPSVPDRPHQDGSAQNTPKMDSLSAATIAKKHFDWPNDSGLRPTSFSLSSKNESFLPPSPCFTTGNIPKMHDASLVIGELAKSCYNMEKNNIKIIP